jgi:hypothetical protein
MSPNEHADVLVIGFGVAGAVAALAAVDADARVLVLDQSVPADRGFAASRGVRSRDALRAGLRAAARAAGVEVRTQCRVHELVVDAGQVCGVGYAALPARGPATAGHRWIQRMSALAPARVAPVLTRAAEEVWRSAFTVGEISCSSVVLALDPRHWEFVGSAMWAASRARHGLGAQPPAPRPRRLHAVPADGVIIPPTPELAVRTWCALHDEAAAAAPQAELRVDDATGAVYVSDDQPVPGLYSAVGTRRTGAADRDSGAVLTAGRRAGQSAAARCVPSPLRSVL